MKKVVCYTCGSNRSLTMGGNENRIVMRGFSPIPCPLCGESDQQKVEMIVI